VSSLSRVGCVLAALKAAAMYWPKSATW
jgi:hypothetical protein